MSYSDTSSAVSSHSSASTLSEERTTPKRRAQRPNNWWVRHAEKFSEVFCDGAEQRFSCGNGVWNEDDEDDDVSNNFSVDDYNSLGESTLEGDESFLVEVPKSPPVRKQKKERKKPKKPKQRQVQEFKAVEEVKIPTHIVQEFKAVEEVKIPTHIIQKPKKQREATREEKAPEPNEIATTPTRRKETKEQRAQRVEDNIKSYSFFAKFGVKEVKYEEDSTARSTDPKKTKKVFDNAGQGNHRGWGPSSRAASPQKNGGVSIRTKMLKEHLLPSDDDDDDEDTFDDTLTADSLMRELSLMDHDEDQTQLLSRRDTFDDTHAGNTTFDGTFADSTTLDNTTLDDTYSEEETCDGRSSFASSQPFDERSGPKKVRSNHDYERELPSFGSSKNGSKNKGISYIAHDQSFGSSSYGTTVDRLTHGTKSHASTKPHVVKPKAIKPKTIKPLAIKPKPVTVAQHRRKSIDLGKNRSRSGSSSLTPQQFNYAINHALRSGE